MLAQWHSLAKLRRHTSITITALRHVTTRLGHELHSFKEYTSQTKIYETPHEVSAWQQCMQAKMQSHPKQAAKSSTQDSSPNPTHCQKYFNLHTSKFHALGDYADTIETLGTTDSMSTQIVSQKPNSHLNYSFTTDSLHRVSSYIAILRGVMPGQINATSYLK